MNRSSSTPPSSRHRTEYCAPFSAIFVTSLDRIRCRKRLGVGPRGADLAHVGDVEHTRAGAHGHVLLAHSLVLHRHLPAGERHQPGAGRLVAVEQGGAAERIGGGRHVRGGYPRRLGQRPRRTVRVRTLSRPAWSRTRTVRSARTRLRARRARRRRLRAFVGQREPEGQRARAGAPALAVAEPDPPAPQLQRQPPGRPRRAGPVAAHPHAHVAAAKRALAQRAAQAHDEEGRCGARGAARGWRRRPAGRRAPRGCP